MHCKYTVLLRAFKTNQFVVALLNLCFIFHCIPHWKCFNLTQGNVVLMMTRDC